MALRIEHADVGPWSPRNPAVAWVERLMAAVPTLSPPGAWHQAVQRYVRATITLDGLISWVAVSALAAPLYGVGHATVIGLVAALGFIMTVAACGGYRLRQVTGPEELRAGFRCAGVISLATLVLDHFDLIPLSKTILLPALTLTIVLATLTRLGQRANLRRQRRHGTLLRRTLLVGCPDGIDHGFDVLGETASHGLTVVGVCAPAGTASEVANVVGDYDAIPELVDELAVDVVLVAPDAMPPVELRRLGWRLAGRTADLLVIPPLTDVSSHRVYVESTASTPLLGVSLKAPRRRHWAKELLDRIVGAALLMIALLVIGPAALVVRLTSRGPAFFAQRRVGLNGVEFTMHKLRSMYIDAESRLEALLDRNEGNGMLFKMREDPRITPVGRLLRRFSVDELPQLWNVVKGDMALVGPRPALPREVAEYDDVTIQRLRVKPGVTGLWQVSGRSDLSVEQSVRLDLRYADNWTIGMDLHTLGRTARAVIGGSGAY